MFILCWWCFSDYSSRTEVFNSCYCHGLNSFVDLKWICSDFLSRRSLFIDVLVYFLCIYLHLQIQNQLFGPNLRQTRPLTAALSISPSHYNPSFGKLRRPLCDISQSFFLPHATTEDLSASKPRGAISFQSKANELPQSTTQVLINIQAFAFKSRPI